jgi:thioredoxin-dependent peroxiredoxin
LLKEGMAAPDFELEDSNGKVWRLRDLRGKRVILYFYPADDTPGCTAEACDFRDSSETLERAGYAVLGVSPQDAASHRAFAHKYSLNFPLLIDKDLSVAEAYGALGEPRKFGDLELRVKRSTFVIDESGLISEAQYGVKAGGHVERLKAGLGVGAGT